MDALRPHLALTVTDVDRAIPFYARQDKIWVRDPDGASAGASAAEPCGCGETGCGCAARGAADACCAA